MEKLKKIITIAIVTEEIKVRRKNILYRNWWDRNCTRKKRDVQDI